MVGGHSSVGISLSFTTSIAIILIQHFVLVHKTNSEAGGLVDNCYRLSPLDTTPLIDHFNLLRKFAFSNIQDRYIVYLFVLNEFNLKTAR